MDYGIRVCVDVEDLASTNGVCEMCSISEAKMAAFDEFWDFKTRT